MSYVITNKQISARLKELEKYLKEKYKLETIPKKRDWRTYEQKYAVKIKRVMKQLDPLLKEATKVIELRKGSGKKSKLNMKQKLILLLEKQLVGKSNRLMETMLCLFSLLSEIDVSYKTIERLYSDDEIEMGLHNLHMLLLKKKNVQNIDACGDATGYAMTIRKHYATEIEKRKDKAKKQRSKKEKKKFVFSFMLMDLKTKMYVCYGTSFKSEKEAFENAHQMLQKIDIDIKSIRLDKYYSCNYYVKKFENSKIYIIPRKNATLRGSWKWKKLMKEFVEETMRFLHEYYQRNNSESGIASDKKIFGWKVGQKRPDRVDTAIFSTTIWHNLLCL